jgi:hypothetical protein
MSDDKKPIPYDNKRVFRKTTITQEEYNLVEEQAAVVHEFLNDDRFAFIRELLTNAQEYARDSIVENTIMDVSEETIITDTMKRIFHQSKKVQVDELSGQYKLVKKFFEDLSYFMELKQKLDEKIAEDKVRVDDGSKV